MSTTMSRWIVPIVGVGLALLIAAAELGRNASPIEAFVAFAIVAGYAIALRVLQSRSDVASLLSGMPGDERWAAINTRALAAAAQVLAIVLVIAFLVVQFGGGDAMPYAWIGAVFGVSYLGALAWIRSRS
jgi:hypothetical protein